MSDTSKNENKDIPKYEFNVNMGDIVWHIADKCICEVISLHRQQKPVIYITKLAGNGCSGYDIRPEELELLLAKKQIQYEVITSDNSVKAFYKGKMILDLTFSTRQANRILHHVRFNIRRNYIYNQLLEMYPDSKISEAIDKDYY